MERWKQELTEWEEVAPSEAEHRGAQLGSRPLAPASIVIHLRSEQTSSSSKRNIKLEYQPDRGPDISIQVVTGEAPLAAAARSGRRRTDSVGGAEAAAVDRKPWGASRRRTPGGPATKVERTREGWWVIIAEFRWRRRNEEEPACVATQVPPSGRSRGEERRQKTA